MAKIKFDIKYRPQIESGEYKVVTKDNKNVRIISWDMHTSSGDKIVALVTGQGGEFEKNRTYHLDGRCCSSQHDSTSLYILTDSVGLTEFEMQYATYRYGSQAVEIFRQEQIEAVKKEWTDILAIAREEMMKDAVEAVVSQVPCANEIIFRNPASVSYWYLPSEMNRLGLNKGDKVNLIIIKE